MAQFQVNLEGVPITVDNRRVSLDIIMLDARNPRIGLFTDSRPKTTFSDAEIRAFRDMNEVYCTRFRDDPYQSQKFSYFVEYERSNRLKQQVQQAGFGIAELCDWVGTQRIPKAEDVRTLGEILADNKGSQYFLQEGYGRAIQHLSLTHPDLVSPLFQRVEDVIERLNRLTFYELQEICDGKQPGRKRLLEKLASVSGQIWRRVSEGEGEAGDEQSEGES